MTRDPHIIATTCTRDCANTCGLVATTENGRVTKLRGNPDHPFTRGVACVKAARYVERTYHPERIVHPLIRQNGGKNGKRGNWRHATWDEALDLVAERMKTISNALGPEAILYYQGYGERTALKLLNKYFFNLFGGVTTLRGSLCGGTGQASQNLDFGERISHDPLDHENSGSMVLWARNPVSTNISLVPVIRRIKKRGGRVVVVDPARTKSVQLADRHIMPAPGKDAYLAMAVAKRILATGVEDREFMDNHAVHAAEYEKILERWSVEELATMADVSLADVDYLTETYMQQKPTATLLGWGLHRHEYAHLSIRAIDALGAISGNLGVPGGGVSQGFEEYGPYDPKWWGDDLNPPRRTLLMPRIGEEILAARNPQIRMIFTTASNPVCMAPNSDKVAEAFDKAEFVVYSGHFMDDTASRADVFLPATTFLEEYDAMASYGHNYLGLVTPAIEPVGECKSEFRMFHELAARFPFADKFRRSEEEWLRLLLKPAFEQGATLEGLKEGPFRMDAPMVPYEDKTFATPSGKYQFMREFDPTELEGEPDEFPYRFITYAAHDYICSERTMAEHGPLPEIILHANEAASLGLADGDTVTVSSRVGTARATLRTGKDMRRDVAAAERGGWLRAGHGLNKITRDLASKVGQGTPYYETKVGISRCEDALGSGLNILVVWNSTLAPLGVLGKAIQRTGATLEHLRPLEGEAIPASHDGYDGIVVLGGPQDPDDDAGHPYFTPLLELMRGFDSAGKPVMGVCLGCQLLARAFGANTGKLPMLELGFLGHTPTHVAEADPVLGSCLPLPRLMEFHQDTYDLPDSAELLIRGAPSCPNQAFRVGNCSYGFQFHLEIDATIVKGWIDEFTSGVHPSYDKYRPHYDDAFLEELMAELPILAIQSEDFCRKVTDNWLALAKANKG